MKSTPILLAIVALLSAYFIAGCTSHRIYRAPAGTVRASSDTVRSAVLAGEADQGWRVMMGRSYPTRKGFFNLKESYRVRATVASPSYYAKKLNFYLPGIQISSTSERVGIHCFSFDRDGDRLAVLQTRILTDGTSFYELAVFEPSMEKRKVILRFDRPFVVGWAQPMAVSPDGKRIAVCNTVPDQDGLAIDVYPFDGASPPVRLPGYDALGHLNWTPDSRFIVYQSTGRRNRDIGINKIDVVSGERSVLARGFKPSLSPSGTKVAYFDFRSLYVKDLTTGEVSRIAKAGETYFTSGQPGLEFRPVWSPDGRYLHYTWFINRYMIGYILDLETRGYFQFDSRYFFDAWVVLSPAMDSLFLRRLQKTQEGKMVEEKIVAAVWEKGYRPLYEKEQTLKVSTPQSGAW